MRKSLHDQAIDLRGQARNLKNAEADADRLRIINMRFEELREVLDNIQEQFDWLATVSERGASPDSERVSSIARLATALLALLREPHEEAGHPLADRYSDAFKPTKATARNLEKALTECASELWDQHYSAQHPGDHNFLFALYEKDRPRVIERLRALRSAIDDFEDTGAKDSGELSKFDEALQEYREEVESLIGETLEPELEQLLRAVAAQGAPLADFTPEVLELLESRGIKSSLKVVPS